MWTGRNRLLMLLLGVLSGTPGVRAATLTVTAQTPYAAADGDCSLVEAIDNANDDAATHADCLPGAGADRVELRRHVILDGTVIFTPDVPTGLPSITSELTIEGDLKLIARNPAAPAFRILHVAAGGDLTLVGVAIQGGLLDAGFVDGGGLYADGHLTLDHVRVRDNAVRGIFPAGGGLYGSSTSVLTVIDSEVLDNTADNLDPDQVFDVGGGIYSLGELSLIGTRIAGNAAAEDAGGVYSTGTLRIENSVITDNHAGERGGGIAAGGVLDIHDATVSLNTAGESGGGLHTNATAEIITSVFEGNVSPGIGGGGIFQASTAPLSIRSSLFEGNRAMGTAIAGAIASVQLAEATISGTVFRGNSSEADGGALYTSLSTVTLEDCLIEDNQAVNGGGLFQGASNLGGFRVHRSTLRNNHATTFGGGLYAVSTLSTAMLFNTTLSGNTAFSAGGGIMLNSGGLLALTHVTVSGNESEQFINSVGGVSAFAGEMTIGHSIIAGNLNDECSATSSSISEDYNITLGPAGGLPPDRWCSFVGLQPNDLTSTDPLLATLADLGNLGPAHALMPGSPAIAAVPQDCPASLQGVDQRGVPRAAGQCDVGAVSADAVSLPRIAFALPETFIDDEGTGAGPHSIDMVIDHPADGLVSPGAVPLTVAVRVTGTATRTADFDLGIAHPVAFIFDAGNWPQPGTRETVAIPITVLDDDRAELDEQIDLELIVHGPGLGDPNGNRHVVTIIDDDRFIFADSLEDPP